MSKFRKDREEVENFMSEELIVKVATYIVVALICLLLALAVWLVGMFSGSWLVLAAFVPTVVAVWLGVNAFNELKD